MIMGSYKSTSNSKAVKRLISVSSRSMRSHIVRCISCTFPNTSMIWRPIWTIFGLGYCIQILINCSLRPCTSCAFKGTSNTRYWNFSCCVKFTVGEAELTRTITLWLRFNSSPTMLRMLYQWLYSPGSTSTLPHRVKLKSLNRTITKSVNDFPKHCILALVKTQQAIRLYDMSTRCLFGFGLRYPGSVRTHARGKVSL